MATDFLFEIDSVALLAHCPSCGEPRGWWCKTKTGNRAQRLHESRVRPASNLYMLGFKDGRERAEKAAKRDAEAKAGSR